MSSRSSEAMGGAAVVQRSGPLASFLPGTTNPGPATSRAGLALVALALVFLFTMLNRSFLSADNFIVIGVNSASLLIAVTGTAALLIAGYVDLSIGSMLALIGIVVAKVAVATQDTTLAILTGMAMGLLLGTINGYLVRKLTISPLIVTLAMLSLYGGLAYVISSTSVYGFPEALLGLGRGKVMGIPFTVLISIVVFLVGAFVLTATRTGLRIYAVGGDSNAASMSGVPVGPMVLGLYAINGLLIGVAAVLVAGRLGSVTPAIGARFELDVLTAAILGGVAFNGGAGRPLGIAIGVATIGILNAGLIFVGLQSWWQQVAVGALLLVALGADQFGAALRVKRARAAGGDSKGFDLSEAAVEGRSEDSAVPEHLHAGNDDVTPVFSVEHASKTYGAVKALSDASFKVRPGEVVCLLGDNGAGKSTLVKIISGAIPSDTGRMTLDGSEVRFTSPHHAREAGLETVYQDLAMCPNLSITHNMILGQEPRRKWLGFIPVRDDAAAAETCRTRLSRLGVRLRDETVLVSALSGGQRQSLAIARSLADHVKLVCLDEPTAALGVRQTAQVIRQIHAVAAKGTGVVLVTHDLSTVRQVADRIVVLRLGEVVYDGPVKQLSADDLWSLMASGLVSRPAASDGDGATAY